MYYTDEKIKEMIKKDHPKMSEEEVEDTFQRLDAITDILFDDWLKLKKLRSADNDKTVVKSD